MKGRNLIFTGLVALALGVVLIIFHNSLANGGVVVASGIIFVVAGILNISVFVGSRDKEGRARNGAVATAIGWVASGAAVVLGAAMLFFSQAFVAIVGFMFAVLLLFAALFQFFLLLFGSKPVALSNWYFLLPMALVGVAIFIFMRKPDDAGEHIIMISTGLSFALFGIVTMIQGSIIGKTNRSRRAAAKSIEKSEPATDADSGK